MHFVTLDFETFFDTKNGYTLKKMTTEEYVRDSRFRAHGLAIKAPTLIGPKTKWVQAAHLPELFATLPWDDILLLCHHAQFDGLILAQHYGVKPKQWACSLSMARLLLGNHIRVGLDSLASHFGLAPKTVPYREFDGLQWEQMPLGLRERLADGAIHDVDLTAQIFGEHLAPYFPRSEYAMVDMTVRMFTEPVLAGNVQRLGQALETEQDHKADLLRRAGVADRKELLSDERFAALLRELDVEPGRKRGKNGPIYAFAKTDPFMEELLQCEDEEISVLAEARLAVHSTIEETRSARLLGMAKRGPLCLYLSYCGAATTRWSGGDRINAQNLTPELQTGIEAPDGHDIVKVDASQIECRLLNYMAGQWDVVERFRSGADPYVHVASTFYGFPVNKAEHPTERQVGKILELQCGYGSGGLKIAHTLRTRAGIVLDEAGGIRARDAYRSTHREVQRYWWKAEDVLHWLADGTHGWWGPLETADGCIWLPNGCPLIYDTLALGDEDQWLVQRRRGREKLYGAKLVENVIQALARVYIAEIAAKILAQGLKISLMRHDDLVMVVKHEIAQDVFRWVQEQMRIPPWWAKDIPLDCEGFVGKRLR